MSVDTFLSVLDKVRKTGADSWIACCPAHPDKHPSMTIKNSSDGRVLVRCFAECSFEDIVAAAGVSLDEFFPDKPLYHRAKPFRRPYPAADVLECLTTETTIVQIAAVDLGKGIPLSEVDRERLRLAAQRIRDASEVIHGR